MNNGIIVVNKPTGMTSRDVVNVLNKKFNTKKIGHTGTLDPLATGVLVLCINEGTKLCEILTGCNKEYIAEIKLGIETDTGDITGKTIKTSDFLPSEKEVKEKIMAMKKSYLQEVPMYSAIRINGKRLYEYARNNIKVELPKRNVDIFDIDLLEYKNNFIKFRCYVSKGTYIRSLIKDICDSLNVYGTMQNLCRTKLGNFIIDDAYTLEQIENNEYNLISIEDVLSKYETIVIDDEELLKEISNGAVIKKNFVNDKAVYKYQNKVLAIYQKYAKNEELAKPYKMFNNY